MSKPRFKDDNGEWVYEGDTITFSYGIPPVAVMAKIDCINEKLWARPINRDTNHDRYVKSCPLRALRRYVGAWWKEES